MRYDKLGMVHCMYLGVSGYIYIFKILHFLCEDLFTLTNSVVPDEMPHLMGHYIWNFTVKSTCMRVSLYTKG